MTLPPERILLKRRREEEPVDALYLERSQSSNKRRVTDFCFQRLIITEAGQLQSVTDPGRNASLPNRIRSSSSQVTAGAPLVQTTTPGAEARDALLRKAAREQRLGKMQDLAEPLKSREQAAAPSPANRSLDNEETKMKPPYSARHFRLARNTSSTISSRHPTGIRKHTQIDRFHLATIVEKHVSLSKQGLLQISDRPHPVDRIVDHAVIPGTKIEQSTPSVLEGGAKTVQPFMKTPANIAKTGNSIRDHPSTWDHDSDQLANELAAIALEIENENLSHKSGSWKASEPPRRHSPMIADPDLDMDEDYVYETFVRVPRSELPQDHKDTTTNIGMLVIEEEDEELWQTYAEDEEDSEWDEEDADSNAEDNPRNDYPEDEVSFEDEYGHGAYRYRNGASDDEEYDLENDGARSDNDSDDM